MPRGTEHGWPSDKDIVKGCVEYGSPTRYATEGLGVAASTLRHRMLKDPALKKMVYAALAEKPLVKKVKVAVVKALPGDEVSREHLLEAENAELRKAVSRERKDEVERERIVQRIESALDEVPAPSRVGQTGKPKRIVGKETPHHRQLLALSDWHGGEVVDPSAVNGLNQYDWSIMEERVDELVHGLLSHKANSPALTGLDIALVGDMVSGNAHGELRETNEFPLAVQAVKMGHLLGQTVERLTGEYDNIRVVSVVGNHPRLAIKPAAKNVHDNMDWVAAMMAADFLKAHPNVSFRVPTGTAALHEVVPGKTMYIWHSDGVRSSMPGIPWGGIMRRVNEIRRSFADTTISYWLCGHWHQCNVMADLGLFMNGSLKGTDEWVQKTFGAGSPPSQLLLTFSEKHRWLTDARFITPTAGLPQRAVETAVAA